MRRVTKQRQAILRHLTEKKRPLSIEEIEAYVAEEIPTINLSTIYRNLKELLREEKVALVSIPKEKPRYEVIERAQHHHHFLCDRCHRTFKIEGCPNDLLKMIPEGFRLRGHSIILNGLCMEC